MNQSKEEQQSREAARLRNFWSLIVASFALSFLVAILIVELLVISPFTLKLGPNYSSILIKSTPFFPLFTEGIKVEEIDDAINRPTVYEFYENPRLDVFTTYSEAYETSLPPNAVKEWAYYFNEGSQINISYSVNSSSSYSLELIVAEGSGLAQRHEGQVFLSRTEIHGSGTISQDIRLTASNFVAVVNSNSEVVQVRLDIKIKASLYNTTGAYSECKFQQKECSIRFFFLRGNVALLTSPPQRPDTANGAWSIKISYERRWISYPFGLGGMIFLFYLVSRYFNAMI